MRTRYIRTLAALLIIVAGVFASHAQKTLSDTERSVRAFYDSYAEDLRTHKRESLADRYDRRGVYHMGNGAKSLTSFDAIRDLYVNKWTGPKSFDWKDLSVEVISKDAAVVVARFEWVTETNATLKFSYTALLLRQDGKWRIRVEDESTSPQKQSGN